MASSKGLAQGAYASAARSGTPEPHRDAYERTAAGGKPVFIKDREVTLSNDNLVTSQEMYKAVVNSISATKVQGIQKIGGLWRLYISDRTSRLNLIISGLNIRNSCVNVFDLNPFLPATNENLTRVLIKDIPLSVHDVNILNEFESRKLSGKIILQRLRVNGRLAEGLTGDRVFFIEKPAQPLPRFVSLGSFKGRVFHADQLPNDQSTVCSYCLNQGASSLHLLE